MAHLVFEPSTLGHGGKCSTTDLPPLWTIDEILRARELMRKGPGLRTKRREFEKGDIKKNSKLFMAIFN